MQSTKGFTLVELLGDGTQGGYTFSMSITQGQSGQRQYFVDDSGVLRTTLDGTPAGPASPII